MYTKMTYAQAVEEISSDPGMKGLIEAAYLDSDPRQAWQRYYESAEWKVTQSILNLKANIERKNILDVGCGNGLASVAFAKLGQEVTAIDPDDSLRVGCGAIKEYCSLPIKIVRGLSENLPFPDQHFDIVYGRQVLHHFLSLSDGLKEMSRVLKVGGKMLICREHVVDDESSLQYFLKHHPLHRYHGGEMAYSLSTYTSNIKAAKFRILKILGCYDSVINHFPLPDEEITSWLYSRLKDKVGSTIASLVCRTAWIDKLYRNRLSTNCRIPGRLYSFLCEKI